jgi:hypothetical protein
VTPACDPGVQQAARLQRTCHDWLILWGRYDRQVWAFPRFRAAPGTILAAAGTGELITAMRAAERAAAPGHIPPLPYLPAGTEPRTGGR